VRSGVSPADARLSTTVVLLAVAMAAVWINCRRFMSVPLLSVRMVWFSGDDSGS